MTTSARLPAMLGHITVWASPVVGGLATSTFLAGRDMLDGQAYGLGSAFMIWFVRDTVIGYLLALPALLLIRRLGVTRLGFYILVTMLLAAPMGYVLANPVDYAWTPREQDFEHGPYWILMAIYMTCAGLTGATFHAGGLRRQR